MVRPKETDNNAKSTDNTGPGAGPSIPQSVLEAVEKEAVGDRLSCPRAREIAYELGVPVRVVGQAADKLGIKIFACELGCF